MKRLHEHLHEYYRGCHGREEARGERHRDDQRGGFGDFGGGRHGFRGGRGGPTRFFGAGDLRYVILQQIAEKPSHGYEIIKSIQDRLGGMYLGRIVEIGPGEAIFATPRHPYTRLLLDAIPDLEMVGRTRAPIGGEVPSPIDPPPGCAFHPRCPKAADRCRTEAPALEERGGAWPVACHFA